ncbi:hypothetical protein [Sphingobacterium tabacisoli]|uniref:Uncharacterized protein n=1 Tax=Sphingobacterium tabacisoli TaxID=2044855 RepID=A0ABW5L6Y5_9SPHI|nr:hypothetical protein [Sphingobacterium tabacisoli]
MRQIFFSILLILGMNIAEAQDGSYIFVNQKISNPHLKDQSSITGDYARIAKLQDSIYEQINSFPRKFPTPVRPMPGNSFYYEIYYHEGEPEQQKGLLVFKYGRSDYSTVPIEESLDNLLSISLVDEEEDVYVQEIIKRSDLDAGYFFRKSRGTCFIVMHAKGGKTGNLTFMLDIRLPDAEKKAFVRDFINQTAFL